MERRYRRWVRAAAAVILGVVLWRGLHAINTFAAPPNPPPAIAMEKYAKPPPEVLRQKLDSLQYQVTQQQGTEPAFKNTYWDNNSSSRSS